MAVSPLTGPQCGELVAGWVTGGLDPCPWPQHEPSPPCRHHTRPLSLALLLLGRMAALEVWLSLLRKQTAPEPWAGKRCRAQRLDYFLQAGGQGWAGPGTQPPGAAPPSLALVTWASMDHSLCLGALVCTRESCVD